MLEGVVDAELAPVGADLDRIVHDVAQPEHEPGAGALGLERAQTLAKLPARAERLVIHQHQLGTQAQRGFAQQPATDAPEAQDRGFLLPRGLLDGIRRQAGRQLDVVASLGQHEVLRDRRLGRDVDDQVGIARQDLSPRLSCA